MNDALLKVRADMLSPDSQESLIEAFSHFDGVEPNFKALKARWQTLDATSRLKMAAFLGGESHNLVQELEMILTGGHDLSVTEKSGNQGGMSLGGGES